jgi:hypothetical protein
MRTAEPLFQGEMQAIAEILGQGNRIGVTKDLDRLSRRVDQQPAVVAMVEMLFHMLDRFGVQLAIEKIAELVQDRFTVHSLAAHF